MVKGQVLNKEIISPKNKRLLKDNIVFIILNIFTFISVAVIIIKVRQYTAFLLKQNPNYYYPTLFEITIKTSILTSIILILKISLEKALVPFTEKFLLEKYKTNEFKHEKEKAKRKMVLYCIKFFHYLFLTIFSYFIFKDLEFFPDVNKLYIRGLESFSFFKRPKMFDFHYLLNLAYTFSDLICVLFIYDRQTDFIVMMFHHSCTIGLILFSYYIHCDGIGAIILFLHNASDIIPYFARTFLYIKAPILFKKVITVILLINFVISRQIIFGKIIYNIWYSEFCA